MHPIVPTSDPVADSFSLLAADAIHSEAALPTARLIATTQRELSDFPTFVDSSSLGLSAAYAVVLRDVSGLPIHGGFFGVGRNGIVQLRLTDRSRGIDTELNPEWAAFGIELAFGSRHWLRLQDAAGIRLIPWTIDDTAINRLERFNAPSPHRVDVRQAYVRHVLPTFQRVD